MVERVRRESVASKDESRFSINGILVVIWLFLQQLHFFQLGVSALWLSPLFGKAIQRAKVRSINHQKWIPYFFLGFCVGQQSFRAKIPSLCLFSQIEIEDIETVLVTSCLTWRKVEIG